MLPICKEAGRMFEQGGGWKMKALEMLKDARNVYVDCNRPGDIQKVDEAIAELEELMKPKNCGMCKHYCSRTWKCARKIMLPILDIKTFCCNRYEPKEKR